MRLSWSVLLVGAIASSIPLASSHEVHLSYLPASQPVPSVESYLSVEWSMQNGKLFANGDLVFPPSMSMQVHAPRYEGAQKTRIDSETLYYALEVRPLSSHEVGAPHGIVRVDVEFMDREGHSVTPNTVVLDLLDHPDGNPRITKIRIEPGKSRADQSEHKWQMKFWQTEMGALFKHTETKETKTTKPTKPSQIEASVPSASTKSAKSEAADPKTSSVAESTVGYIFSPYFAPSSYSHRTNRHAHGHHDHTFMRLVRPVVLPALLGAVAGLLACLLGFLVGHVIMSVSYRLGLRKHPRHHLRARTAHVEDGIVPEKAGLLPEIYVTESEV